MAVSVGFGARLRVSLGVRQGCGVYDFVLALLGFRGFGSTALGFGALGSGRRVWAFGGLWCTHLLDLREDLEGTQRLQYPLIREPKIGTLYY